jgi:ABC-type nitrate/sulfonate/bicarbonate transport system substrate-binding protein
LAVQVEPFVTEEEEHGTAQRIVGLSQLMPGFVQAVTMYGERLGKRDRALGERFMRALVKSNMYLRQALTTPSGRAEIARIYQKYVPLDNPALYERLGLANGPPTLAVDVEGKYGLRWQLQQYAQEGLIQHQPDMNGAVDTAFAASVARK